MPQANEEPTETIAACVQFDVRRGDVAGNVAAARSGIAEAAAVGARLCVLPEMWSTSFMSEYDDGVQQAAAAAEDAMLELSRRHDLAIIGSSLEVTAEGTFNCARVYVAGREMGTYRKVHLFSPNVEHRHHVAGRAPLLVDTGFGRVGVLIGYDLRFPELARYYFRMGAEILAIPAQWPEARSTHWRTLLRARAIENGLFVIGCNRTGQEISLKNEESGAFLGDGRIVDPTGEILAAGTGDDAVLTATLELRTVRTLRRILPVDRDQRPSVYRRLWDEAFESMRSVCRESEVPPRH